MKKIAQKFIVLLSIVAVLSSTVLGLENAVNLYWDKPVVEIDNEEIYLHNAMIRHNKATYLPVDEMLLLFGYTLGWNSELSAVVAIKDDVVSYVIANSTDAWKGEEKYVSSNPTVIINDIFYMPIDMLEFLLGREVKASFYRADEKVGRRDLLTDIFPTDEHRLNGDAFYHKTSAVINNHGMMLEYITDYETDRYISALNLIAETAPANANIYSIIVPTAAEFFAPSEVAPNQTETIKKVYNSISERITPINTITPLISRLEEGLYFKTDHHWTQRGAYYVYKEFMQVKGEEVPHLEDFITTKSNFTGSIAEFAKGTIGEEILRNNPDVLEKFYPNNFTAGACYLDMYMRNYACPIEPVYYNANSYLAFIGGDMPMVVFTSGIDNGKKLLILKESYGNAFAPWALNNYSEVYIVDVRQFNRGGEVFNLNDFYNFVQYDDLVIINSASSLGINEDLAKMAL